MQAIESYWDDMRCSRIYTIKQELISSGQKQPTDIMAWDDFFIAHARLAAKRSPDAQTKIGAVLVDPQSKTVISTGYNGYVRGARDECLPNMRPEKYKWMIHAEHNAILNCARLGRATLGSHCYITHRPCEFCLQYMSQAGIIEVVYCMDNKAHMDCGDEFYATYQFMTFDRLKIREIKVPDTL